MPADGTLAAHGGQLPEFNAEHILRVVAMPPSRTFPGLLDELAARFPGAVLTARAVRRAHRIPPGRSPSPPRVRARESEMPARTECGCRRRRVAVASP